MGQLSSHGQSRFTGALSGLRAPVRHRWAPVLLVLFIPWLLGWSWKDASGDHHQPQLRTADPGRQDHQTGSPPLFWRSQGDRAAPPRVWFTSTPALRTPRPCLINLRCACPMSSPPPCICLRTTRLKRSRRAKTGGKILRSTLEIRFKADGDIVMSHEYKEF